MYHMSTNVRGNQLKKNCELKTDAYLFVYWKLLMVVFFFHIIFINMEIFAETQFYSRKHPSSILILTKLKGL